MIATLKCRFTVSDKYILVNNKNSDIVVGSLESIVGFPIPLNFYDQIIGLGTFLQHYHQGYHEN